MTINIKTSKDITSVVKNCATIIDVKNKLFFNILNNNLENYKFIILNGEELEIVSDDGNLSMTSEAITSSSGCYKNLINLILESLDEAIELNGLDKNTIKRELLNSVFNNVLKDENDMTFETEFDEIVGREELDLDIRIPGLSITLKNDLIELVERISDTRSYKNWAIVEKGE